MMDVNPVALRLSGYEKEELLNKPAQQEITKGGQGLATHESQVVEPLPSHEE
jgi:hypothetical protein